MSLQSSNLSINANISQKSTKKFLTYFLSFCGSAMEYYNYMLFIYLIPYWSSVLGQVAHSQYMNGFIIVLITSLCRPFAAHIIGTISDVVGRRVVLFVSAGMSAIASGIISLLPYIVKYVTNNHVILLFIVLICRLLQVIGAAGSLNNSPIFLMDHYPAKKGFISGLMWGGSIFGMMLAAIAESYTTHTTWPRFFQIGGITWIIGFLIMRLLSEGKDHIKSTVSNDQDPYLRLKDLAAICIAAGISGSFYYMTTYIPILFKTYYPLYNAGHFRFYTLAIYGLSCFMSGLAADTQAKSHQVREPRLHSQYTFHIQYITKLMQFIIFGLILYFMYLMNIHNIIDLSFILLLFIMIQSNLYSFILQQSMRLHAVFISILCVLSTILVLNHHNAFILIHGICMMILSGCVGPSHYLLYDMYRIAKSKHISRGYSIGTAIFGGLCGPICLSLSKITPGLSSIFCIFSIVVYIIGITLNIYCTRHDSEHH